MHVKFSGPMVYPFWVVRWYQQQYKQLTSCFSLFSHALGFYLPWLYQSQRGFAEGYGIWEQSIHEDNLEKLLDEEQEREL